MLPPRPLAQAERMKQTVLRSSSPADLAAAIPAMLGYTPENSLVLIPLRRKRSTGGLRVELDQVAPDPDLAVHELLALMEERFRAEALVLAVFTEQPLAREFAADASPRFNALDLAIPHAEFIAHLQVHAAACRIQIATAVYFGPDGFCEYPAMPAGAVAWQRESAEVEFQHSGEVAVHPELIGIPLARDPRVVRRESDAKTRAVLQRLLDEREQNRLANAQARDRHEQTVDPHPHAA